MKLVLKGQKGYTLAEVLVATLIFFIITSGIVLIFPLVFERNEVDKNKLIGYNLAQGKLEELKSLAYQGITDEDKKSIDSSPGFFSQVLVKPVNVPETTVKAKQVTVRIYHRKAGEDWLAAELTTLLTE